ncbi:protein LTO1 homolog isoform X2 [Sciurus carolinensis]|uniref:protein LTO1 homolog isoform X2 n=1 Tax=Sciurus carolinensis TaxID=30640 RepID=UPI001FB4B234|nr:protein LTO1 homolog isoform X2 [Sciurus carolinensis]
MGCGGHRRGTCSRRRTLPRLFADVCLLPVRFHGEGYQEGYKEGSCLGRIEGRQHGALHGAKIGSEIGCYQGFAFAWKHLLHSDASERDRKMKVLEALIGMIQKFPYDDPAYDRLHEDLERIRGKFKQLCSLLNVQPDFKMSAEGSGLSF